MSSSAVREKKITASQKRLEKAQADKADLLAKVEGRHLEWVQAMPVDDEPAPPPPEPWPVTGM